MRLDNATSLWRVGSLHGCDEVTMSAQTAGRCFPYSLGIAIVSMNFKAGTLLPHRAVIAMLVSTMGCVLWRRLPLGLCLWLPLNLIPDLTT